MFLLNLNSSPLSQSFYQDPFADDSKEVQRGVYSVCMCVFMLGCVVHTCVHVCRDQRKIAHVVSQKLSILFIETKALLAWSSPSKLGLLPSEPQG